MKTRSRTIYPNLIAQLGGAIYAETNGVSYWVALPDRVIRMPHSQAWPYVSDGLRIAEVARIFAYRNL